MTDCGTCGKKYAFCFCRTKKLKDEENENAKSRRS